MESLISMVFSYKIAIKIYFWQFLVEKCSYYQKSDNTLMLV